jgi:hypothetical protein
MTCHTAAPFALKYEGVSYKNKKSPLYISHVFRDYVSSTSKTTVADAKLQGVRDFLLRKASFLQKKK